MAPPASHHFIQDTDHLQVSWQTRLTSICLLLILQDEIRKLERDLSTLSYKSSSMSASYQRDRTEVEEFRRETLMIEAEVREWMGRDARVASSVLASQDSGRLLAGMDVEARSLLDEDQGAK